VTVYSSGKIFNGQYPASFPPALGTVSYDFSEALAAEYPTLNPANITSMVAFTKAGNSGGSAKNVACDAATIVITANSIVTDYNQAIPGVDPDVITCSAQISDSLSNPYNEQLTIGLVGLAIYYTGSPAPPVDANLAVGAPLTLIGNVLGLDPSFPQEVNAVSVATLNGFSYGDYSNSIFVVNDYNSSSVVGVCTGGGTNKAWATAHYSAGLADSWYCYPFNPAGGGGSGTVTSVATGTGLTGGPITVTGTISCVDGSSSVKGCVQVDGTTITATGGVISAVGGAAGRYPTHTKSLPGMGREVLLLRRSTTE